VIGEKHLDEVETLGPTVDQVALLLSFGEIDRGEPGRLALDEKGDAALVD